MELPWFLILVRGDRYLSNNRSRRGFLEDRTVPPPLCRYLGLRRTGHVLRACRLSFLFQLETAAVCCFSSFIFDLHP